MTGRRRRLRWARGLQLAGLGLMVFGLAGFVLSRDVNRGVLSASQLELLGIEEEGFHASFVLAGRDTLYTGPSEPVYGDDGQIVCWRSEGEASPHGTNTDAVAFVLLRGSALTLVMLPRDVIVGNGLPLNHVYRRHGPAGLREAVAQLLGVPVDYHAVINLDIFERLVDALGGVEVNVPIAMNRRDCAAELTIDLQPGLQRLDGREAGYFVRYRVGLTRGDIDRVDNVKLLAYALLERVRELGVGGTIRLPELLDTFLSEVETNVTPALLRRLLPRVGKLELEQAVTLPVTEVERDGAFLLEAEPVAVEGFLAELFGGRARRFARPPEATVLISNRSGQESLGEWYRLVLEAHGVPSEQLMVRSQSVTTAPTRVVATGGSWSDAEFYARLLGVGRQQLDRFGPGARGADLELVLGSDAVRN